MSYRIPQVGQEVHYVRYDLQVVKAQVGRVVDIGEGIVILDGVERRYVDPTGAKQYEGGTWHFTDESDKLSEVQWSPDYQAIEGLPSYALRYILRR